MPIMLLRTLIKQLNIPLLRSAHTSIPESANVVIIGGGVIGFSTAYHLCERGFRNVLILEKHKITSGTTWHTAGCIWRLRPSDTDIQLLNHTRYLLNDHLITYEGIESTGWIQNGGLFLAHSRERLIEYRRLHGISKYYGIEAYMLDKSGVNHILGALIEGEESNLIGGLYSPGDGNVDPTMYCNALKKAAGNECKVIENAEVIGINIKSTTNVIQDKKIAGVILSLGPNKDKFEIKTDIVVNASGVWAPSIAGLAGIDNLPQEALEHAYIITEPMPGIVSPLKIPNIRDHDLSLYSRTSGQSLKIGGYETNPQFIKSDPKSMSPFTLFDLNWDAFTINLENAIKLMPRLKNIGIKTTISGAEAFTPDHKPILGEDSKVSGFFHASGFNSLGMNLSGGCGRELAKWIINGRPELNMFAYDIRRFNPDLSYNKKWVKDRCIEAYAKNYSIVYPFDESIAGRTNTWKDSLYSNLSKQGCVFQESEGKERPSWFDTQEQLPYEEYLKLDHSFKLNSQSKQWKAIKDECLACRQNVAVFNTSYMGKIAITGDDAQEAIEWLCTSNIKSKPIGSTVYTCLLNFSGGVESDVTVSKVDSNYYYMVCSGFATNHTLSHICYVINKKNFKSIKVENITSDLGILSIQGPNSPHLIKQELGISEHEEIQLLNHKQIELNLNCWDKLTVRVMRITFVGELGWELHLPMEKLEPIYNNLMKSGTAKNAGFRAIDCLSTEKGYRHWFQDLRSDDTPEEAGIGFTVDRHKLRTESFFGARSLKNRNKLKFLRYMTLNDNNVSVWGLEPIYYNNKVIGYVRKGSYGFTIDKPIAIGYFKEDIGNDNCVNIEVNGKLCSAQVHQKSPFDPKGLRIQGIY